MLNETHIFKSVRKKAFSVPRRTCNILNNVVVQ